MASDAFFPFPDCVEIAHQQGVLAVIQPGGSVRDQDSINYCDEQGMAMVLTGLRHFKHWVVKHEKLLKYYGYGSSNKYFGKFRPLTLKQLFNY